MLNDKIATAACSLHLITPDQKRLQRSRLVDYQAGAALPSSLSVLSRFAISMAVTAASPPLLPVFPPALSSAYSFRKWAEGSVQPHCITLTKTQQVKL